MNTEGCLRNQHELEDPIPITIIVARKPEFSRKLTMGGKDGEFQAKGGSPSVFA